MIILNGNQPFANIDLLLTTNEAKELKDAIEQLLDAERNELHHLHVSSSDYQTEISVTLMDNNNIETYQKPIIGLIKNSGV